MKTRILHLSDMHIGGNYINPRLDDKSGYISSSINNNYYLDRLKDKISTLATETKTDYVVISGDIIHQGKTSGYPHFQKMVDELIQSETLPNETNFVVVPGNHDVMATDIGKAGKQLDVFNKKMHVNFAKPWDKRKIKESDMKKIINSYFRDGDSQTSTLEFNKPFVVDKNRKIAIYALNSCQFCQCLVDEKSIDLPRIDISEIEMMKFFFEKLRSSIGYVFNEYLCVCVAHHPLTTIAAFEEVKEFEIMSNAGLVKEYLKDCNIKLFLHGHKHWPEVYFDTAVSGQGGFAAISGGTIFAKPENKRDSGFFIIDFDSLQSWKLEVKYIDLSKSNAEKSETLLLTPPKILFSNQYNLTKMYIDIGHALSEHIFHDKERNIVGWDKLIEQKCYVGTIGTAIGICIADAIKIQEPNYQSLKSKIADDLWNSRKDDGGFGAFSEKTSSITATCWIAKAFLTIGQWDRYEEVINSLNSLCHNEESEKPSVFVNSFLLKTYIEAYCRLKKHDCYEKMHEIKDFLLNTINRQNHYAYWGDANKPNASYITETSYAILALLEYEQYFGDETISELKLPVISYLMERSSWSTDVERIRNKTGHLTYEHYTATWFIRALLKLGLSKTHPLIEKLLNEIISNIEGGLCRQSKDAKIWEIYDSVEAIETYIHSDIII